MGGAAECEGSPAGGWMEGCAAQGDREGVRLGVWPAGCAGRSSGSAVFLIHVESLGQAPGGDGGTTTAGRLSIEERRVAHGECERHVTANTGTSCQLLAPGC